MMNSVAIPQAWLPPHRPAGDVRIHDRKELLERRVRDGVPHYQPARATFASLMERYRKSDRPLNHRRAKRLLKAAGVEHLDRLYAGTIADAALQGLLKQAAKIPVRLLGNAAYALAGGAGAARTVRGLRGVGHTMVGDVTRPLSQRVSFFGMVRMPVQSNPLLDDLQWQVARLLGDSQQLDLRRFGATGVSVAQPSPAQWQAACKAIALELLDADEPQLQDADRVQRQSEEARRVQVAVMLATALTDVMARLGGAALLSGVGTGGFAAFVPVVTAPLMAALLQASRNWQSTKAVAEAALIRERRGPPEGDARSTAQFVQDHFLHTDRARYERRIENVIAPTRERLARRRAQLEFRIEAGAQLLQSTDMSDLAVRRKAIELRRQIHAIDGKLDRSHAPRDIAEARVLALYLEMSEDEHQALRLDAQDQRVLLQRGAGVMLNLWLDPQPAAQEALQAVQAAHRRRFGRRFELQEILTHCHRDLADDGPQQIDGDGGALIDLLPDMARTDGAEPDSSMNAMPIGESQRRSRFRGNLALADRLIQLQHELARTEAAIAPSGGEDAGSDTDSHSELAQQQDRIVDRLERDTREYQRLLLESEQYDKDTEAYLRQDPSGIDPQGRLASQILDNTLGIGLGMRGWAKGLPKRLKNPSSAGIYRNAFYAWGLPLAVDLVRAHASGMNLTGGGLSGPGAGPGRPLARFARALAASDGPSSFSTTSYLQSNLSQEDRDAWTLETLRSAIRTKDAALKALPSSHKVLFVKSAAYVKAENELNALKKQLAELESRPPTSENATGRPAAKARRTWLDNPLSHAQGAQGLDAYLHGLDLKTVDAFAAELLQLSRQVWWRLLDLSRRLVRDEATIQDEIATTEAGVKSYKFCRLDSTCVQLQGKLQGLQAELAEHRQWVAERTRYATLALRLLVLQADPKEGLKAVSRNELERLIAAKADAEREADANWEWLLQNSTVRVLPPEGAQGSRARRVIADDATSRKKVADMDRLDAEAARLGTAITRTRGRVLELERTWPGHSVSKRNWLITLWRVFSGCVSGCVSGIVGGVMAGAELGLPSMVVAGALGCVSGVVTSVITPDTDLFSIPNDLWKVLEGLMAGMTSSGLLRMVSFGARRLAAPVEGAVQGVVEGGAATQPLAPLPPPASPPGPLADPSRLPTYTEALDSTLPQSPNLSLSSESLPDYAQVMDAQQLTQLQTTRVRRLDDHAQLQHYEVAGNPYSVMSLAERYGVLMSNEFRPDEWQLHANYCSDTSDFTPTELFMAQYSYVAAMHGFLGRLPSRIVLHNMQQDDSLKTSESLASGSDALRTAYLTSRTGRQMDKTLAVFGLSVTRVLRTQTSESDGQGGTVQRVSFTLEVSRTGTRNPSPGT